MVWSFVNQDLIDDAEEAIRSGIPIEDIAGQMRLTEEELFMLLGRRPQSSDVAADADEFDLWRADEVL